MMRYVAFIAVVVPIVGIFALGYNLKGKPEKLAAFASVFHSETYARFFA